MSAVALDELPGWEDDGTPVIVRVPADQRVWRFGDVYSIWQNGDFWRNSLGSRRAWSTSYGAQDSIALYGLNDAEW
jgi:hypothetical protein